MTSHSTNEQGAGIYLTPESIAAARRFQEEQEQFRGLSLRVYLEGKGCDGFYYGVTFDEPSTDDLHFPQEGIDVIIDRDSFDFCVGSTIVWVDDERGRGFMVENPQHRKFRGKFYKRKVWQDRLLAKKSESARHADQ